MDELVIDFETKSECDIEKSGSYKYSEDESTRVLMLAYKFNDLPTCIVDVNEDERLDNELDDYIRCQDVRIIAHNYAFEWCIWKNVCIPTHGWPKVNDNRWFDTMHQCGMHGLPLNLEKSTEVLKLTSQKNEIGKSLIKFFCIPNKDGKFNDPKVYVQRYKQFLQYCIEDVDATYELYHTLIKFKPEEQEVNIPLTHIMNANGIPVDVESAKIIYPKILLEKESYTKRISELTGGLITTVNQTARMKKWVLSNYDIEMPNFQAETVSRYLEKDHIPQPVRDLLEMRAGGGKSSTSKYERLLNMASKDNCIHSVFIYHGTTTGRVAGRAWQPTNLAKPSVKYESMDILINDLCTLTNEEINEKYSSFMKAASTAMRGHIKAPDGKEIFGADYAAIEARVVFWLANCKKGLQTYHDGLDLYKEMATKVYKTGYDDVTDDQRWLGKQIILGCGYGIGWKGFQNAAAQYNVAVSEDLCQLAVETYRETYHEIPMLWDDIEKAAMMAMTTGKQTFAAHGRISFKLLKLRNSQMFLYMKLPSGRLITYPRASVGIATTPWGAKKKAVLYRKLVNNVWCQESTYGGKLTENACQAIARDIMYVGMNNAHKSGFDIIMQIYDELIALAPKGFMAIEDYEKLLCSPMPDWAKNLPLAAEGKILTRYQKL